MMLRTFLCTGLGLMAASGLGSLPGNRQPVLVELFTSEGCSSCPPGDALLERLDREQPVAGARIIVLSEHVDYWNHIGWADPYSSPALSSRQEQYARRFHTDGPYTPQMVVDGKWEFVGSDARTAESAIRSGIKQPKVAIRIGEENGSSVVEVDPLPAEKARKANVYVAYAADAGVQDVLRGENRGRRLHHVAIVKDLKQVGTVDGRSGFKTRVTPESGARLIVFVQEPGNGPVLGAAMRAAMHAAGR
jgi:hypothetical protein